MKSQKWKKKTKTNNPQNLFLPKFCISFFHPSLSSFSSWGGGGGNKKEEDRRDAEQQESAGLDMS